MSDPHRLLRIKRLWSPCPGTSQFLWGWRRGVLLLVPLLLFLSLFTSVSEMPRKSAMGERSWRRSGRPDHLVLGPAAGQGRQDRIQCQGSKAWNKIHSSKQFSKLAGKVTFVTVFTIYNNPQPKETIPMDRLIIGNVSYDKTERSITILNTFFNFIQVSMPWSNIIILTDPASSFPIKRSNVALLPIQGDYSRENLMLQRIKSYIEFLNRRLGELSASPELLTHYIFTDSDIAVVSDVGHIFQDYPHFDLALTFRNNKGQPLNSGFIAVRGNYDAIQKAILFLQKVLHAYVSRYMKASRMLGDQMALAWVIKSHPLFDENKFGKPKAFLDEIGGASVLFLPCALYNWTPPEGAGQFHGMPLDVKVIHFKGSRKRLMLESWNFLNSSASNLSDMLCLILLSGRTKYDF